MSEEIVIEAEPERLALPPPTNYERVAPSEMPLEPDAFRAWADWACAEWSAQMQAEAFLAWEDAKFRNDDSGIYDFRNKYRYWYALSEMEREGFMPGGTTKEAYDHRRLFRKRAMMAFKSGAPVSRKWSVRL